MHTRNLLALLFLSFLGPYLQAQAGHYYLIAGTYNQERQDGLFVYELDLPAKKAIKKSSTKALNPSYFTLTPDNKTLFTVNENGNGEGKLSAYKFEKETGRLFYINQQPSGGDAPCYISVDSSGYYILSANYAGGSLSLNKTNEFHFIRSATQVIQHEGKGPNLQRQEAPHVHSAMFSPDEQWVFAADLGNDRLYRYKLDTTQKKEILSPSNPAYFQLPAGSGPRHMAFHPGKKPLVYVLNELSGAIVALDYSKPEMQLKQTIFSDATGTAGDKGSADIHLTPNGKFLYSSNRGVTNDLAIFKVKKSGKLKLQGRQKTGAHPRNFVIDPSGRWLLVACQDSNMIQVFEINASNGMLTDTGMTIELPKAVCLKLVPFG